MTKIVEDKIDPTIMDYLRIQCENCRGLCCVILYFTKMDGFPENKEAKVACHHLQENYHCRIYPSLASHGLKGCMAYDCFGAGQVVSQLVESKKNWKTLLSDKSELILSAYVAVMKIHQTLWYCSQCLTLRIPVAEKETAHRLIQQGKALISQFGLTLTNLQDQSFCDVANPYLKHISELILSSYPKTAMTNSRNYMGKNMSKKILREKILVCLISLQLTYKVQILKVPIFWALIYVM